MRFCSLLDATVVPLPAGFSQAARRVHANVPADPSLVSVSTKLGNCEADEDECQNTQQPAAE